MAMQFLMSRFGDKRIQFDRNTRDIATAIIIRNNYCRLFNRTNKSLSDLWNVRVFIEFSYNNNSTDGFRDPIDLQFLFFFQNFANKFFLCCLHSSIDCVIYIESSVLYNPGLCVGIEFPMQTTYFWMDAHHINEELLKIWPLAYFYSKMNKGGTWRTVWGNLRKVESDQSVKFQKFFDRPWIYVYN